MPPVTRDVPKLTLEGARIALDAAERRAREIGVPMDIAIVDDGGHLMAFIRMDGAKPSSVAIAVNKAHCSAIRRQPTGAVMEKGEPNVLLSLSLAIGSEAKQTPLRGGLPLVVEGHVVGAIGVSNSSEDQDTDVARAGVEALAVACRTAQQG